MLFQRRRFLEKDQSETIIACGGHVLPDRDEMSIHSRGPAIDASYQVSLHLAKRFQRRIFSEKDQSKIIIACGGHVC